jgi:drug/metabolite transporter (DMT)-like permease
MPYLGEIAGLTTALCWSLTAIVFTAASKRIGSLQVNLYRLPMALTLLFVSYFFIDGRFEILRSNLSWLLASGVVGLAIGDSFLFEAMVLIGARLSMILMALAPPITALLAYFFLGETVGFTGILGIAVTIGGVSWVVAERRSDSNSLPNKISWFGILCGVLGALFQAIGLILAKKGLSAEVSPLLATLIRMSGATAAMWSVTLFLRKIKNPVQLFKADYTALKQMLLAVVFGPVLGVTLSLVAIKYTETGIAATLIATVPVVMIPFLIVIEKEWPTWRAVLGAVVTVGGIAMLFLR